MEKIKNRINKIKKTIHNEIFIMESLFLIGILIITTTNFYINIYFGLYFLGIIFIAYSIFLFKSRKEKR